MKTNIDMYKELDATMPWVVGLVITKRNGKINICPITFQLISSIYEKPHVVCIGLANNHSLENILKTKEFTYAYPSKEQIKDTLYCGTVSGKNTDKLKSTSFTFDPSKLIDPPHLKDAVANFECVVIHTHKLETFTIVVGKIKHAEISDKTKLDKIYALGDFNYGIIEKVIILKQART